MKIFALQTARAGSKSVPNKNILTISGKPLYLHNVEAALNASLISKLYISTNCKSIKNGANKHNYNIIDRPLALCEDEAPHHEVIKHGLAQIEKIEGQVNYLVILLGNALGASSKDLDSAIQMIQENDQLDSIMSVSEFNMFNPFRAHQQKDGLLQTIVPQYFIKKHSSTNPGDRTTAGKVLFFNGSFFVCKRAAILSENGQLPFTWLGKRIKPFLQNIKMELDAPWQIQILEST